MNHFTNPSLILGSILFAMLGTDPVAALRALAQQALEAVQG